MKKFVVIFKGLELALSLLACFTMFLSGRIVQGRNATGEIRNTSYKWEHDRPLRVYFLDMTIFVGTCAYYWIIAIMLLAAFLKKDFEPIANVLLCMVFATFAISAGVILICTSEQYETGESFVEYNDTGPNGEIITKVKTSNWSTSWWNGTKIISGFFMLSAFAIFFTEIIVDIIALCRED